MAGASFARRATICLVWLAVAVATPRASAQPDAKTLREANIREIPELSELGIRESTSILDMVNAVDTGNLLSFLRQLTGEDPVLLDAGSTYIQTRYAEYQGADDAAEFLADIFTDLGLVTEVRPVVDPNGIYHDLSPNVIATRPGITNPNRYILLIAHYDSINPNDLDDAPGADDNGSGVAAIVEAARILSQFSFYRSIRFVCFSAEELGKIGSRQYVARAVAEDEAIAAVLNLDMIGWSGNGYETELFYNNDSWSWANEIEALAQFYVPSLPLDLQPCDSCEGSDYLPFWDAGFEAVSATEPLNPLPPHYHSADDVVGNLDFAYLSDMTRIAIAAIATEAHLIDVPNVHYVPTEYASIQAAIDDPLVANGHEVVVLPDSDNGGNPYAGFDLESKHLTIRSQAGAHLTTILGSVILEEGQTTASTKISGFTITGGDRRIDIGDDDTDHTACTIEDCIVLGSGNIGIDVWGQGAPVIRRTQIDGFGKGLDIGYAAHPQLEDCRLRGNGRGLVLTDNAQATLTRCQILSSGAEGIESDQNGRPHLYNCVVAGSSYNGMRLDIDAGSVNIVNSVFHNNGESGIFLDRGQAAIINSIFTENGQCGIDTDDGSVTVSYSDFYANGFAAWCGNVTPGSGILNLDPCFVDAGGFDFRLSYEPPCYSPCVDSGSPAIQDACQPPGLGAPRSDMGAFGGAANCWPAQYQVTIATSPVALTFHVDGDAEYGSQTFLWDEASIHLVEMPALVTVAPGERFNFDEWSDGEGYPVRLVTVDADTNYTANFLHEFELTVATEPPDLVVIPGAGWYGVGTDVTLQAPELVEEFVFAGWEMDGIPLDPEQNPITVTMDAPHAAVATYGSVAVNAWNDGPICEGADVQLHCSPDGMSDYAWTGPGGFSSDEQHPLVPSALAGDYCVDVSDNGVPVGGDCTFVEVHALPAAPANVHADPPLIDEPQLVELSADVEPGLGVHWYEDGCREGFIGEGSTIEVYVSDTSTYYAAAVDPDTDCASQQCGSVVVELVPVLPVALYPLDGNADDASGNGNHGIVLGDVDFSAEDRFGLAAHAAAFDGDGDGLLMPYDAVYQPATSLTAVCWVKTDGLNPEQLSSHLVNDANLSPAYGYFLALNAERRVQFRVALQSAGSHTLTGATALELDRWYHVAGVLRDGQLYVYVNGVRDDSLVVGGNEIDYGSTVPLRLGYHAPGSGHDFHGTLDDVAVYGRALSDAELGWLATAVEPVPSRSALLYCVPNPFNPTTTVHFVLSGPSDVSLAVYDSVGRRVRTLLGRTRLTAGNHQVQWNGCDDAGRIVASGVYYCGLLSTDEVLAHKMVLLK